MPWNCLRVRNYDTYERMMIYDDHIKRLLLKGHWIPCVVIDSLFSIIREKHRDRLYLPTTLVNKIFGVVSQETSPNFKTGSIRELPQRTDIIKKVLMPCNFFTYHWYLVVANLEKKKIYIYDSFVKNSLVKGQDECDQCQHESLVAQMKEFLLEWIGDDFELANGRCPQQEEGDCGIQLIRNAAHPNVGEGEGNIVEGGEEFTRDTVYNMWMDKWEK